MADDKKYYYLKLKENFFDSDEMIILESMPDGYLYSNILLKLYLRSLKYKGRLMFNDRIPFNSVMLAQVTRHNVGVVEKAMQVLQQLGLVDVLDNGAIYMNDIQNFIGKSNTEADRVRRFREQKKLEQTRTNVVQMYDKRTPEIEKEIKTEIESDKQRTSVPDYEQIRNLFVGVCKDLPQPNSVKTWTDARKKTIARANMDLPEWERLFKTVAESDFLCGKKTDWKASFDWIIKPANRQKILEGAYKNTKKPNQNGNPSGPTSYNIEEFESALLEDMMGGYDGEK